MTDEHPDGSHPTHLWTCQALWPAHDDEDVPTWRAVFFDTTREGAARSMAWALDQEDGHLGRALDFRVAPPTLDKPRSGSPWDPPQARRRAPARPAPRVEPTPSASKAPEAVLARPAATRARAADRFRAAARPKKGTKR